MELNQIIKEYKLPTKQKITNERQDIIRQFLEVINAERVGTKYKPMTGRGVAMILSHLKDNSTTRSAKTANT